MAQRSAVAGVLPLRPSGMQTQGSLTTHSRTHGDPPTFQPWPSSGIPSLQVEWITGFSSEPPWPTLHMLLTPVARGSTHSSTSISDCVWDPRLGSIRASCRNCKWRPMHTGAPRVPCNPDTDPAKAAGVRMWLPPRVRASSTHLFQTFLVSRMQSQEGQGQRPRPASCGHDPAQGPGSQSEKGPEAKPAQSLPHAVAPRPGPAANCQVS